MHTTGPAAADTMACTALWGTHSTDRVSLYHGSPTPARMCGRHAAYLTPADYVTMREAGTII